MEDTLNNGGSGVNNTVNNGVPVTNPTVNPVQNPAVPPITSASQVSDTTNNAPVNTGEQYEVNQLHPEDLDAQWTRWKCLVCNYIYEGSKALKQCPRCGNADPDKFEDID